MRRPSQRYTQLGSVISTKISPSNVFCRLNMMWFRGFVLELGYMYSVCDKARVLDLRWYFGKCMCLCEYNVGEKCLCCLSYWLKFFFERIWDGYGGCFWICKFNWFQQRNSCILRRKSVNKYCCEIIILYCSERCDSKRNRSFKVNYKGTGKHNLNMRTLGHFGNDLWSH